jgi:glycosyltransferase involved in cell wall biosynthesis
MLYGVKSHLEIKLLILESHPVQYHAPVYRELARLHPGQIHVVYASDCSVRGHRDPGFGRNLSWDVPLLDGYDYTVLHAERGEPLRGLRSLHGRGIPALLRSINPSAVLFSNFAYEFEWVAYVWCLLLGIPMWLRTETQDDAFVRRRSKTLARAVIYRLLYAPIARFFCIGELNRRHYLVHGVPERKLAYSRYCAPDRFRDWSTEEKHWRRTALRGRLGFSATDCVVGFFGKLTPKKNPVLLLDAWRKLPESVQKTTKVLVVGDGEMRLALEAMAQAMECPVVFAGFINQSELADYYLAADIVVLPSQQMGETWGLVVNEALLAGCSVVISEAVGCGVEFAHLAQIRIIRVGESSQLAEALEELARLPRNFDWARPALEDYSIEAAAKGISEAIL